MTRTLALLILPAALLLPHRLHAAETKPAAPWTLEMLAARLAKTHHVEAKFEETVFSTLLTEPVQATGVLGFTPPARLEKHVIRPRDELFIADGDKIFTVNNSTGETRTLSLDDHPALRSFVEAFRSMLAGDVTRLRKYFQVELTGSVKQWILRAEPLDLGMKEHVRMIYFDGAAGRLDKIEIQSAKGDRSVMVIDEVTR
jgi:outer membrane lipoprotein-sorting protein